MRAKLFFVTLCLFGSSTVHARRAMLLSQEGYESMDLHPGSGGGGMGGEGSSNFPRVEHHFGEHHHRHDQQLQDPRMDTLATEDSSDEFRHGGGSSAPMFHNIGASSAMGGPSQPMFHNIGGSGSSDEGGASPFESAMANFPRSHQFESPEMSHFSGGGGGSSSSSGFVGPRGFPGLSAADGVDFSGHGGADEKISDSDEFVRDQDARLRAQLSRDDGSDEGENMIRGSSGGPMSGGAMFDDSSKFSGFEGGFGAGPKSSGLGGGWIGGHMSQMMGGAPSGGDFAPGPMGGMGMGGMSEGGPMEAAGQSEGVTRLDSATIGARGRQLGIRPPPAPKMGRSIPNPAFRKFRPMMMSFRPKRFGGGPSHPGGPSMDQLAMAEPSMFRPSRMPKLNMMNMRMGNPQDFSIGGNFNEPKVRFHGPESVRISSHQHPSVGAFEAGPHGASSNFMMSPDSFMPGGQHHFGGHHGFHAWKK